MPSRLSTLVPVALVTAAVTLCACTSSKASSSPARSAATPVSGGSLTFAVPYGPDCLDPHEGQGDIDLLSRPVLDSLVSADSTGKFHPWLATSWRISADQRTYTFTLRTGVTFSDGEVFDAAAVKANLDHVVAPATKSEYAASLISTYDHAVVVNPTTVRVVLKSPASSLLSALALPELGIEAPATLKMGSSTLCSKIVGTGPFVSSRGLVTGQGISYTRRADYGWPPQNAAHRGPAHLNTLDIRIVPAASARSGALTSGQLDAAGAIAPVDVARVKAASGYTIDTVATPGVNYSYIPNVQHGVLRDVRVREALRVGINYPQIVKNLYFGVYPAATGPLASTTPGYDPAVARYYAYDPAAAAASLDAAGWTGRDSAGYRTKNGTRLSIDFIYVAQYFGQYQTLGTQIQAAAKRLGVQINFVNLDLGTFTKRILSGDYDIGNAWSSSATPDVLRQYFDSAFIPTAHIDSNAARYDNPTVDAWFAQALATTDPAGQNALYAKVQRQLTDDATILPIFQQTYVLGLSQKVRGVTFEAQLFPTFYDTWITR